MTFEITAEISGNNAKLETRLFGDYTAAELKVLDKLLDYAIIKTDNNKIRKKDNWVKGDKGYFAGSVSNGSGGRARMTRKEYYKVCHEIVTNHPMLADGEFGYHFCDDYFYTFIVIEPGNYKFVHKINYKKSSLVQKWRTIIDE